MGGRKAVEMGGEGGGGGRKDQRYPHRLFPINHETRGVYHGML